MPTPPHPDPGPAESSAVERSAPMPPSAPLPRRRRHVLRAGAAYPRGRRSPFVRSLVALTSSGALLVVAALVAAATVVPPIGARRTARELAAREVQAQLEPGEQVVATTFASQRRWTDMWRESFGVVVATDRRVLYVGAPPTPLLRPRDEGPRELFVESYRYDAAFTLDPRAREWKRGAGLVLRTPAGRVDFIVDPGEMAGAFAVAESSAQARREVTRQAERLDESHRAAPPPPPVYVPYVVRRGETLIQLARRFGTTPEVLQQLNQLPSDVIRAGQRLRVPAVDSTAAEGTPAGP